MASPGTGAERRRGAAGRPAGAVKRAILTYHSIDRAESVISVAPETFRAHITSLVTRDIPVVPLATLLTLPASTAAVAITFDDGLESVLSEAAPVLAEFNLPATLYVVSDAVGRTNAWRGRADPGIPLQRTLSWDELGGLMAQGWTIGSHTRSHPRLTRLPDTQVHDELEGSAEMIHARLGTRPDSFAYPYGDLNAAVTVAARRTYASCCTTTHLPLGPDPTAERLPRLDGWYYRHQHTLADWGSDAWRSGIVWRHRLRQVRRLFQ